MEFMSLIFLLDFCKNSHFDFTLQEKNIRSNYDYNKKNKLFLFFSSQN